MGVPSLLSVSEVMSVLAAWAEKNIAPNSAISATRTSGSLLAPIRGDEGVTRHATATGGLGETDSGGSNAFDDVLLVINFGDGPMMAPNERIGGVPGEFSEDMNVTLLNADASIFGTLNGVRRNDERRVLPVPDPTAVNRGRTEESEIDETRLLPRCSLWTEDEDVVEGGRAPLVEDNAASGDTIGRGIAALGPPMLLTLLLAVFSWLMLLSLLMLFLAHCCCCCC